MTFVIAATCGVCWAASGPTHVSAGPAVAAAPVIDIAGRWVGHPRMLRADPSRCGPDGCPLTLDIVACSDGWCGIDVSKDGGCGGQALTLKASNDYPGERLLKGKLTLAEGTQSYVVEASHNEAGNGYPATLSFVGDTGPELMMIRRSFPFQAHLSRSGDAVCKLEKPVS